MLQSPCLAKAVGVMIRCHDDHGIVGNSRILQLPDERGQAFLQLQIAGAVSLHTIRIGQILHQIPVLPALGIAAGTVPAVTADAHIVDIEGLFVNVGRKRSGQHFQVALGPAVLYEFFHPVPHTHVTVGIAQICVG